MKRYMIAAVMLFCTTMTACSREEPKLMGILFERGHGSAWGNQFYIEVYPQEIQITRYFPGGSGEQVTREQLPISQAQWQQLAQAVEKLELREQRSSWKEKIFGQSKQDGREYRNLALLWQTGTETVQTYYQWPQSTQAQELEALLEQLARTVQKGELS